MVKVKVKAKEKEKVLASVVLDSQVTGDIISVSVRQASLYMFNVQSCTMTRRMARAARVHKKQEKERKYE